MSARWPIVYLAINWGLALLGIAIRDYRLVTYGLPAARTSLRAGN